MKKRIMLTGILLLVMLLVGCQTAGISENVPTISVDAQATTQESPDEGEIYVTVLTRGEDASVQNENALKTDEVIAAMVAAGVDKLDIETTSIDFYPTYRYDQDTYENTVDGYEARHHLTVLVKELSKVGVVMDEAVAAGAEFVDGVNYKISDARRDELKEALIEEAVTKARAKAEAAAKASGETIDGVQHLTVTDFQNQPFYYAAEEVKGMGDAAATEVLPADVEVQINVTVSYRLR